MNLLKALAAVSSMTLLSRILGFVRDTILARVFGAGLFTDAFFVAFKIPHLLRRLFAEGAFSQAFVPILAEYKNRLGHDATRTLVDQVGTVLTLALVVVALLGIVGAPWVAYVSAPGFQAEPDKFALTVTLLRITFPYIIFISLVALAAGVLNTYSKFSVPAFAPVLLNVAMIGATLWLAPHLIRRCWRWAGASRWGACCNWPGCCRTWRESACCRVRYGTSTILACVASCA